MSENELNKTNNGISKFNRIIFTLIALVAAVGLGYFAYIKFIGENTPPKPVDSPLIIQDASIISGEYMLLIKSNHGEPSTDYDYYLLANAFNREFEEESYSLTYALGYTLVSGKNAKNDYPDLNSLNEITINNKSFKYKIDQKSIKLIYNPENMDCYVTIDVMQVKVLDVNGNATEKEINVILDDVLSNEVSSIINFEVSKR